MITFYDCATAPSPRRARILLAEKGVAHQTVQVDLRSGEQLGDAYRRINPQCTVPALRTDDGAMLTDNAAITAYLEAQYADPPLLGVTPREKGEIASWNWRVEFEGLLAIAEAMRNSSPAMANRALAGPANYAQIPEFAARSGALSTLRHAQRAPPWPGLSPPAASARSQRPPSWRWFRRGQVARRVASTVILRWRAPWRSGRRWRCSARRDWRFVALLFAAPAGGAGRGAPTLESLAAAAAGAVIASPARLAQQPA
jgi:glutathione S-transferase